ncbi:hypothetical protein BBJ28_00023199 [Nothophytophthora sp. Chile5]|nr:hypothetical protein BBJ28_00023199 [Nothophytophthora sp. Chile5]
MPHEKTFKRLWRELTTAGWKARKPRGLSVDYSYVMPGITGRLDDSKRGVDFFVGSTELDDGGDSTGQDDTEYTRAAAMDDEEEEKKSESDGEVNPMDVYDGDQFMDAMRRDNVLGPTSPDDINLLSTPESDTDQSDAEDEDVMADNETEDESDEEEEIEDIADSNDQDVGEVTFDMTDDQLREIAEDGWETYDEDHSAQDYYGGPSGPTRSAVSFAGSPLGMFFYFLPKSMWIGVAEETNRFRTQSIPTMAAAKRSQLLERQAKDPRVSVPTLQEIQDEMKRFKPIKPHEIPGNNRKEKNVGPKAVVRNITKVLHGQPAKRLVITDNYYSSVALSLKLHDIGFYHVGTVRTHRLGWCKPIQYKQKKRPKNMPRGQYKIAQSKSYPYLVARQYLCKVCSAFADPLNKSFETSYHCPRCTEYFGGRVPLCRQVRRVGSGNTLTCAQIWHDTWNDGKNIPPSLKKKIRFRKGKRKRAGVEEEEESN